ncbi:histidine kinase [Actinoplanes sp. SE50]|uniref:sensor histidine kinase n=1 Tax=unclassified Actinoplanes TaxID=2626549 RepID=UPI00023EDD6B|nr:MULTISPECIES: HAMP domain-containing sensor histidine kinase [unclassified Actinoplanes]AEV89173.1 two-component system, OmpR family, sensor histidine kinase VicK [Actinoplanes sp. SE50/110]ATO87581.1 histidine kinase [Actinoplanes sp. SE50]SLM04999.1 two-component system sensor histidine kinase [Actinoplanes sp. SE50/110]
MPDRPDYPSLTRGQIAVLDRVNAGESGLPVLQRLVRLAQEALGARGAGFAEYSEGRGRIIAGTGVCEPAVGRRVDRPLESAGRTLLVPLDPALDSINDEFARQIEGGDLRHMLGARCESGGAFAGSLHVYFGGADGPPGPEHHAVLELLAGQIGQLYTRGAGLPVHPAAPPAQADRDLWVAVTSHELRTPVTVIKGYADTLTNHWETLGEPGRREAVRVIGNRAGELARLVDRLLSAASDGVAGATPAGPFDLVEALREAVDELPADLRRRLKLAHLPAGLPPAYGDRASIATILTELTTNAEKYSPPDTTVEVCAGADDDTLRFRVSDRGAGIAPEHVERAFERYWQAEGGDRHHHPGAGLGLYLVRRIVEQQHGWVSLRPREGGGTVAEVRLRRA